MTGDGKTARKMKCSINDFSNKAFHQIFLQWMWPNPQFTGDLVTFTEEIMDVLCPLWYLFSDVNTFQHEIRIWRKAFIFRFGKKFTIENGKILIPKQIQRFSTFIVQLPHFSSAKHLQLLYDNNYHCSFWLASLFPNTNLRVD